MAQEDVQQQARQDVASRVQEARLNAELTVDSASEQAGISVVTWLRIEHAERVRPKTYRSVEKLFGWDLGSLQRFITGRGAPPPNDPDSQRAAALRESAHRLHPAAMPRDTGPVPPTFRLWLTSARQRAGFATSAALAEHLVFDPELVAGWEDGRGRPEIWEALALSRALRLPEVDVLAEAGHIQIDRSARAFQHLIERRDPDDPSVDAIRRLVQIEQDRP